MLRNKITLRQSVIICKPKEHVWDFTQDHIQRSNWDPAVLHAEVVQHEPTLVVRLKTIGNSTMTFYHDPHERPDKSQLVSKEVFSPIVTSADGRWTYDKIGRGTIWRQINTIVFKPHLFNQILIPFYKFYLRRQIRKGMLEAKRSIEGIN